MSETISSSKNDNFKRWTSLLDSRGSKKSAQYLLSGSKTVPEQLPLNENQAGELILCENIHGRPEDLPARTKVFFLSKPLFKELDIFGTQAPLLVGASPQIPAWDMRAPPQGLEILCPIGDPLNLGALIRTCCGLGVHRIVLLAEAAHPFHPKCLRASSGTALRAPLFNGPSLKELPAQLGSNSSFCYALDMNGKNLFEFEWPQNLFLIVGEEGPGLGHHPFDKLSIPLDQSVESLNVVAATSAALFSYFSFHKN